MARADGGKLVALRRRLAVVEAVLAAVGWLPRRGTGLARRRR